MGPKWEALTVTPNWLYIGQPDLMIWRCVDTKLKDDPLDVLDNMYFQDSSHGHHSHQAAEEIGTAQACFWTMIHLKGTSEPIPSSLFQQGKKDS